MKFNPRKAANFRQISFAFFATRWVHPGSAVASSFNAARIVSPRSSRRFSSRMAAKTWVESVRWRPRALTRPTSLRRSKIRS